MMSQASTREAPRTIASAAAKASCERANRPTRPSLAAGSGSTFNVASTITPSVPNDPDARPSLDEMLELRADRMRTVHDVIATLTDDVVGGQTDPVPPPGYPPAGSYPVRRCLRTIVNEEWLHRLYA